MKAKPCNMFGDVAYVFDSTGRSFTPHNGIWGLTPDQVPRGGYDNTYYVPSDDPDDWRPSDETLTHAECVELGEFMAAQWRAFADKHRAATSRTASDCARRVEVARAELDAALSAYQQATSSADNKVGVVSFRQAEREAIEALNNRR